MSYSSVFIVKFKHVIANWVVSVLEVKRSSPSPLQKSCRKKSGRMETEGCLSDFVRLYLKQQNKLCSTSLNLCD